MVVPLSVSQYSFGECGSSACTAIAASMMKYLLEQQAGGAGSDVYSVLEPNILNNVLINGVAKYTTLYHNQHLAADELGPDYFDTIQMVGAGVTQGILSNPSAFRAMFQSIRDNCSDGQPIGIIITKPPETVCVILPPKDVASGGLYFFFDSHARPQEGLEGSYLVMCQTEDSLIRRLEKLFPSFNFGSEESSYITDMYNMFEGTSFQLRG